MDDKHTPIPWSVITLSADKHPRGNGFVYMLAHEEAAYSAAYQTDDESVMEDANTQHAIDATFIVEAVNSYDRLREVNADLLEALERYMTYCETFGEEQLRAEFGPPEHEGSSWAMEAWLDRVLRDPARAAIARARGENVNAEA